MSVQGLARDFVIGRRAEPAARRYQRRDFATKRFRKYQQEWCM